MDDGTEVGAGPLPPAMMGVPYAYQLAYRSLNQIFMNAKLEMLPVITITGGDGGGGELDGCVCDENGMEQ